MRLIDADVLKQHIDKLPALPDGNFAGNHSALKALINMQPTIESSTNCSEIQNSSDCISRQAAIKKILGQPPEPHYPSWYAEQIKELPSAEPEPCDDVVSRKAVEHMLQNGFPARGMWEIEGDVVKQTVCETLADALMDLEKLPSAQPERTCVNCGRTANNGGWYADGGTRCPIEEHYALPKDGYCHLWEKRNVTDDDYPERRTDE